MAARKVEAFSTELMFGLIFGLKEVLDALEIRLSSWESHQRAISVEIALLKQAKPVATEKLVTQAQGVWPANKAVDRIDLSTTMSAAPFRLGDRWFFNVRLPNNMSKRVEVVGPDDFTVIPPRRQDNVCY